MLTWKFGNLYIIHNTTKWLTYHQFPNLSIISISLLILQCNNIPCLIINAIIKQRIFCCALNTDFKGCFEGNLLENAPSGFSFDQTFVSCCSGWFADCLIFSFFSGLCVLCWRGLFLFNLGNWIGKVASKLKYASIF